VLLDFRGILVHSPPNEWWAEQALQRCGRDASPDACAEIVAMLERIPTLAGYTDDAMRVDVSVEANREISLRWFHDVGIDDEVAEEIWLIDFEDVAWPIYPDAAEVVAEIRRRGCRTVLVSDFHVDLRPFLASNGLELDDYVISFEHGFQKPDPRMFTTALRLVGAEPHEAVMVGDRVSHDGGAAAVGIDTLILPAPAAFGTRGLERVLRLL
jgi:HAD superfamily hydrolase (TIGR01549 family)